MAQRSELVTQLDALSDARSLLKHPFYQAWNAGTLSLERLRHYACQYYRHVEAFPRYLSSIHAGCEDLAVRQALLENLVDEERGTDNHPALWIRFAQALGLPEETVRATPPQAETTRLVETFLALSAERPVPAGLAALYVYEAQIPQVAATKIAGLQRFYGITEDRALSFFTVHQQVDVQHAHVTASLLDRVCVDDTTAQRAIGGAEQALDALWGMLDAV